MCCYTTITTKPHFYYSILKNRTPEIKKKGLNSRVAWKGVGLCRDAALVKGKNGTGLQNGISL